MAYLKNFILLPIFFIAISCSGVDMYNTSYTPSMLMPLETRAFLLEEGTRPTLIMTPDIEKDLEVLINQNYVIVGESKFNGPEGGVDDAIGLAKKLGVTHILLNAKYAYDASKKAYKYVENFDYIPLESGYLAGTGQVYSQIFYEKIPNPIYVPYRKNVSVYHHRAIFLVKMKKQ
jgi:hypothetical protein